MPDGVPVTVGAVFGDVPVAIDVVFGSVRDPGSAFGVADPSTTDAERGDGCDFTGATATVLTRPTCATGIAPEAVGAVAARPLGTGAIVAVAVGVAAGAAGMTAGAAVADTVVAATCARDDGTGEIAGVGVAADTTGVTSSGAPVANTSAMRLLTVHFPKRRCIPDISPMPVRSCRAHRTFVRDPPKQERRWQPGDLTGDPWLYVPASFPGGGFIYITK
jgi:hypothetical protein